MNGTDGDEPFIPRFTKAQRAALRLVGEEIIALADDKGATKAQVVNMLEAACKAVTTMGLRDFRVSYRCPDCLELFTSAATKAVHYEPKNLLKCRHPSKVPELTLKSRGRWGWSESAIEKFRQQEKPDA